MLFAAVVRNAVGSCLQWKAVNEEGFVFLSSLDLITE
jgi:hypothetical protein